MLFNRPYAHTDMSLKQYKLIAGYIKNMETKLFVRSSLFETNFLGTDDRDERDVELRIFQKATKMKLSPL